MEFSLHFDDTNVERCAQWPLSYSVVPLGTLGQSSAEVGKTITRGYPYFKESNQPSATIC